MGLEVGWYLRFSKTDEVTALVDKETVAQLYHQLEILPEWNLLTFQEEGHVRAVFSRITPLKKQE